MPARRHNHRKPTIKLIREHVAGIKPGTPYRHIIAKRTHAGREWSLHATKGWRSYWAA